MGARLTFQKSSIPGGPQLASLLADACGDVLRLQATAARFAAQAEPIFSPEQVRALCGVLDQACSTLSDRIARLGGSGRAGLKKLRSRLARPGQCPRVRALIAAYRNCCRRLCRALQEAKRLGDAATTSLLSGLVLRLEKQLWLLDRTSGKCRAAALFFQDLSSAPVLHARGEDDGVLVAMA